MRALVVFFSILKIVYSSCPEGYELVRNGECRGQQTIITSSFAHAAGDVLKKCAEIQGQPVIIHDDEQESYWMQFVPSTSKGYLILGLVCNGGSKRWEWADGSKMGDYRPAGGYNRALDDTCKPNAASWYLTSAGYWNFGDSGSTYNMYVFCTTQLHQPTGDGCDSPSDDDSDDGMCYDVIATAQSFDEAQISCQHIGASVAAIHNAREDSFIRRLAVANGAVNGVWIGAYGVDNWFEWLDGTYWEYENFYPGFPIAGRGDRLAIDTFSASGKWMNMEPSSKLAVVCARPATPRPTCSSGPYTEGEMYSPGFPYDASVPCDYMLTVDEGKNVQVEVQLLEANSCCDHLLLEDSMLGGNIVANLTGEISGATYTTQSSNFMRVSWQPNGGVNVRGMMMTFRAV